MAVVVTNITLVTNRVTGILLAGTDDGVYGGVSASDQQEYDPTEVRDTILSIDAMVCLAILETLGHPYRSQFTSFSAVLNHMDEIPAHVGVTGMPRFKIVLGDLVWVDGVEVRSIDQIKLWRENYNNIFQSMAHDAVGSKIGGRYAIKGQQVFFTGAQMSVEIPTFTQDRATFLCQSPENYESTVVAGTVASLLKDGADPQMHGYYNQRFQSDMAAIRGQALALPPLAMFERAA